MQMLENPNSYILFNIFRFISILSTCYSIMLRESSESRVVTVHYEYAINIYK